MGVQRGDADDAPGGLAGSGRGHQPIPQAQLAARAGRDEVEGPEGARPVVAPPDFGQGGQVDLGPGDGAQIEDFQADAFLQAAEVAPVVLQVAGQGDEPQAAAVLDGPLRGVGVAGRGQEVFRDVEGQQVAGVGRDLRPD